jgi:hypothetical protein
MQRRDIAIGTGRVLGALALLELGACTAPAQDNDTATTAASVSRNKQSDLPSAAPTAGLLPGTTTWIVPATPNGLQPIQSWFSVAGLPDGNVYMSACDHTTNSALYRLNPADDMLRYIGDARAASEAANNWLPGETAEKFHVRPLWYRGRAYLATAPYSNQDDLYLQRRGFHWYAYDTPTRELMDLSVTERTGVGADHISIFSMALDESRGVIYGLGSPTSHLYRYDIATGQTTDLGRSPLLTRTYYNPGRFMWIDSDGRVYFTVGTAGTLAPGEPQTPSYPLYWDPATGWGARPDWPIAEMLRTGAWSPDHKHLYILDYPLNLYLFDDTNKAFTKLNHGVLTPDRVSPRTGAIRVRAMNISANEKKLYFVNDTAPVMSLYEWDFAATNTPLELASIPAIDSRVDSRYTGFTGHDSWDQSGRFHFTGFGGEGVPSTPNVFFLRVDPVRLKAGLGLLPGVSEVAIWGVGPGLHLVRHGDLSTDINVILRHTPERGAQTYSTVTMPAGQVVVDVPGHSWEGMMRVSVVPDGDTYVADERNREADRDQTPEN